MFEKYLALIIAISGLVGTVIATIYTITLIAKDREERGREMGKINEQIKANTEDIDRAFAHIRAVESGITPILTNIAEIKTMMDFVCKSIQRLETRLDEKIKQGDK